MEWSSSRAGGNDDQNACKSSPARVSDAITIAAANAKDKRIEDSNFGDCIDWFAPGADIKSAWNSSATATKNLTGTSGAAALTTGVAALYLENHIFETPIQVRDALLSYTTKNIVGRARSTNNHLLYSLEIADGLGDYVSPETTITAPTEGTIVAPRTQVPIDVSVSDNTGVVKVEIYVNGDRICSDTEAPFSCLWKVPRNSTGTQQIQSKAYDAEGNVGSSAFVFVNAQ